MLHRAAASPSSANGVPPIVHDVLSSSGQPLDAGTRAFMESRFVHDFSQVRVHTDARAAESAQAANALAYTVGRDVVFGTGQYAPGTSEGRRLVAHELTHVAQQAQSTAGSSIKVGPPGDSYEREAERVALAVESEHPYLYKAILPAESTQMSTTRLQRLGANPGCTDAQRTTIHQAIFNARGWLNKAISQLEASPLSPKLIASLRRNFGPTYGVASNAALILGRLRVAYHEISTIPFSCADATDATCATVPCGYTATAGGHASTICSNVTLVAGRDWRYQAGCVLHESLHAAFSNFTPDQYSGWHGVSESTATYPGTGTDPLLNADSYTTLVMDLS